METSRSTDRKRKRTAPPESDRVNSPVGKEDKRPPPPSEEEVEEFFNLLRRIHGAVQPKANRTVRSTTRFECEPPLVNGGPSSAEKMDRVEEGADNGVMIFDLNAVPEEADEA